jgi:polysaccharide export outer membrane protein
MAAAAALVWLAVQVQAGQVQAGQVAGEATAPYRLQAGDEIQVQVFGVPELEATVRLPPDGLIHLLKLDEIRAAGLTVSELRDRIAAGYGRQYRNPRVTVAIRSYDNLRVYVTGHVPKPGAFALVKGLTAVQAITQAGGLLENANAGEAVVLRRKGEAAPEVVRLALQGVLEQGQADVPLQPGDVIYVPRTDYKVYVGGEVVKPGLVSMDKLLTATAAVFQSGGFTVDADPKSAIILRDAGNNTAQAIKVDLKKALEGGQDAPLKPFDVVYIPKSGIAKVNQAVDQYVRKVIPFSLSAGFSYLLGGFILGL